MISEDEDTYKLHFILNWGVNFYAALTSNAFEYGEWSHYTFVYSGDQYEAGKEVTDAVNIYHNGQPTASVLLGGVNWPDDPGDIRTDAAIVTGVKGNFTSSNVEIRNTVLTPQQVKRLYECQGGTFATE